MPKRILVVDDERDIVDLLTYNLTKEGYSVVPAYNGREALERAGEEIDLIILDLMMPELDGFDTCRRLKSASATSAIPIILLTARSGEVDEILGLELGADDFIAKPIGPRKLVARVKAMFRRAEVSHEDGSDRRIIRAGRLEINRTTYTVRLGTREIFFPRKEFELLTLLAAHPGRVYSREMLLNSIWGTDVHVIDRTVDVHIRRIREKLEEEEGLIETIKGVGYRFRE